MEYQWNLHSTSSTKSEIIALSIRLKEDQYTQHSVLFNDKDVRAFLAGLSLVYEEVFIWTNRNLVAVWVRGTDPVMICRAFQRHYVEILEMHKGEEAISFFHDIIDGNAWSETSSIDKLFQLDHARSLSYEVNALRSRLNVMVEEGIDSLTNRPVVFGLQNGWCNAASEVKKQRTVFMDFSSSLFRLSLN